MLFYARPSWRLFWQIVADVFVAGWVFFWWGVGRFADGTIRALAVPAHEMARLGGDLRGQLGDAAGQVADVPMVGEQLRTPFDQMTGTVSDLVQTAQDQAVAIETAATLTGWLAFGIPVVLVLMMWLPRRLRFAARAKATRELIDSETGTDLLALRALATQSLPDLQKVANDPMAAWRSGDQAAIAKLAELELVKSGVWRRRKR